MVHGATLHDVLQKWHAPSVDDIVAVANSDHRDARYLHGATARAQRLRDVILTGNFACADASDSVRFDTMSPTVATVLCLSTPTNGAAGWSPAERARRVRTAMLVALRPALRYGYEARGDTRYLYVPLDMLIAAGIVWCMVPPPPDLERRAQRARDAQNEEAQAREQACVHEREHERE